MVTPEPFKCEVAALRCTQFCVGMREVAFKRAQLEEESKSERKDFLKNHLIPVVRGPGGELFLTDHHHLARALWDAGHQHAWAVQQADLSADTVADFWKTMEQKHWLYPVNDRGQSRPYGDLPKHVKDLKDDPYRSLAGLARNAGAFLKDDAPFAEFRWAEFFRSRVELGATGKPDFDAALKQAEMLAGSSAAKDLPGYKPVGKVQP
jgi:hypothetical protein